VGFRATETFGTLFLIVGFAIWCFILLGVTVAGGLWGFSILFGITTLVLYVRHPRRKEPEELDEKLPEDRWDKGRARYIEEVRKRNVENQHHQ
jgi:hypothetical protein